MFIVSAIQSAQGSRPCHNSQFPAIVDGTMRRPQLTGLVTSQQIENVQGSIKCFRTTIRSQSASRINVRSTLPFYYLKKGKKKKAGGRSSAGLKKVENKLVPGLNPPPGDMRSFLAQQRLMYDA